MRSGGGKESEGRGKVVRGRGEEVEDKIGRKEEEEKGWSKRGDRREEARGRR